MDDDRFVGLGILDRDAPGADDRRVLLEYVASLGATDEELVRANDSGTMGELALALALRTPGTQVPFDDAAEDAGVDLADASRFWRSLGFPDPEVATPDLSGEEADLLRLVALADDMLGHDATFALGRVLGSSASRMAEAIVNAFRIRQELPQHEAGVPYSQIVKYYVTMTKESLPPFIDAMGAVFRRHLVAAGSGTWSADEEATTTRRDLVIGFADLVGYTAFTSAVSPSRLASLIMRLEDAVSDLAADHESRVVKLIGDGAMFASENPQASCELALRLIDRFADDPDVPPLRVALDAGPVVAVHGDYFGEVVNTAARLLAVAQPSEIVVSERLAALVEQAFELEPLPPTSLKGIEIPARPFRVRGRV